MERTPGEAAEASLPLDDAASACIAACAETAQAVDEPTEEPTFEERVARVRKTLHIRGSFTEIMRKTLVFCETRRSIEDVEQEMAKHKAVIVAVSEGVAVPEGVQSGAVDNFGHKYLSGIGKYLEQLVREKIGCKVRSIELNVMQRCSSHLCSKTDIDESEQIGAAGVQCALNGETGRVMVFRRIHDMPYTVVMEPADASQIANREKFLPREFLTPAGNNISDKAMPYFLPLIQGELNLQMHGGIPKHFTITESVLK